MQARGDAGREEGDAAAKTGHINGFMTISHTPHRRKSLHSLDFLIYQTTVQCC